jgi:16S rRNA (cytidine1402-2'-O)-methyltransferase
MAGGKTSGTLHLVATPVGNLEDLSFRALRTLKECELIAAEDTRRTRKLLTHYGISRPLVSCHEHNERKRIPALLDALREGKDVALVSDAGSPGISDPGFRLVREAVDQGMAVTALPGPSAVILALSVSGLPTDRFSFYGFLPRRGSERKKTLEEAAQVPHTLVFFESPHRVVRSLEDMLAVFGDRRAAICRELTKRFEQVERGTLYELIVKAGNRSPKGEFCIVMEGKGRRKTQAAEREDRLRKALEDLTQLADEPLREAARQAALKHGLSRREVYQLALEQKAARSSKDKG